MEHKIHKRLILISAISIAATLILVMSVFYQRFRSQVSYDLTNVGNIIAATHGWENMDDISLNDDIRITLIDQDGTVLKDNRADPSIMDNHAQRPEIMEAQENGSSVITRNSSTFSNTSVYYYALRLDDGRVLRVSKEASSFSAIFFDALWLAAGLSLLILLLALIISKFLTRSILEPIKEIAKDIDHIDEDRVYKELIPVVQTIQQQHENILKQSKMRQDFTANVTHELKTPLTSISGYSELIETGMASESDVAHFAHEIHKSSDRLLTTINDIIRLSELDSEGAEAAMERVDLYEIAADCIASLKVNADKYQVSLYLEGQSEYINANHERMVELIYNLVDNAIRYNKPDGYVRVSVKDENQRVVLSVKDNGIGIPKRYHERVFERFYRVDKSRSKATGGTGLGLAIVKHIVLNHHGELQIDSDEGKGCEISVYFQKVI